MQLTAFRSTIALCITLAALANQSAFAATSSAPSASPTPGSDDHPARTLSVAYAYFPLSLHTSCIAEIKIDLTATSAIQGLTVYHSCGNDDADTQALIAAARSKFETRVVHGIPQPGSYIFRVNFGMQ